MLTKLKQYAKGVATFVVGAGTIAASALPDAQRLYAEAAVALAGVALVVLVPNAKPADEVDAAETALSRLEGLPIFRKHDAALARLGALLASLAPAEDTGTHGAPVPDPVVSWTAPVVDAEAVPVGDPPADPAVAPVLPPPPSPPSAPPVDIPTTPVADTGAAPTTEVVDLATTLPDDVAPPTVGSFTTD